MTQNIRPSVFITTPIPIILSHHLENNALSEAFPIPQSAQLLSGGVKLGSPALSRSSSQ